MSLIIGKKYLISTKKESVNKESIEVIAVMNYQEAQKEPYDIINLAINEKVIAPENEDMSYLYAQYYYKCLKNGTKEVLILWDDIIDESRTTELSITYNYETTIKIDDNSKLETKEIINFIINSVKKQYGINVTIEMIMRGKYGSSGETESDADKLNKYREAIDSGYNTMVMLNSLQSSIDETIKKIQELNLNDNLNKISTDTESIRQSVDYIKSVVG